MQQVPSVPSARQYVTEPGALDDIAIPAMLRPLPPAPAIDRPRPPATGTEARVCADIAARQALGLRKYGLTVEANPLTFRHWLQHGYEEALDLAIYLRRAMEQIDRDTAPNPITKD